MQWANEKQKADILGPVKCALAYKLEKQTHCAVDVAESKSKVTWKEPEQVSEKDKKFVIAGETMYGGKGKNEFLNINQHELSETKKETEGHREDHAIQDIKTLYDGLSQPCLNDTDKVILGYNKTKNAQRKHATETGQVSKPTYYITMDEL